jgi:hypothetical protein
MRLRALPALFLGVAALAAADAEQGSRSTAPSNRLPGAEEIQAMAEAYPTRIDEAAVRDGEWALLMDDTWYYWAKGRLLPAELRHEAEGFVSIRFYDYQLGPAKPEQISPRLEARLRERTRNRHSDDRMRFNGFLDALYQVSSRAEAERKMEDVEFLGRWTRVHPLLVKPLELVEQTIRKRMEHDPETRRFVERLHQIHGYNWRNIAGTPRRSYHSYGVAVDLVPYRYTTGYAYWQWAAAGGVEEWWEIPLDRRWNVPQPVIDAFEAEGFIWGGKWLFFDNLHFEYRPESILMARDSEQSHWEIRQ